MTDKSHDRKALSFFICFFFDVSLFVISAIPFSQALSFGFINLDDSAYTFANPAVQNGVTLESLHYALFGTKHLAIWFPLTIFSYMLDVELGGSSPTVFHFSSLIWHCFSAVVLFLLLSKILSILVENKRILKDDCAQTPFFVNWYPYLGAAVGALFWSIHPQRIESVVWIAGRKDLVSGLFAFLSLLFYLKSFTGFKAGNVNKYNLNVQNEQNRARFRNYVVSLLFYALAIMGKPVVMTLPLGFIVLEVLLFRSITLRKLIIPCAMAFVCFAISFFLQMGAKGGFDRLAMVPLVERIQVSLASLAYYFEALIWPQKTVILHPWPIDVEYFGTGLGVLVCGLVIIGHISYLKRASFAYFDGRVYFKDNNNPYLASLWDIVLLLTFFIGALFPMLNIFMFGHQARADRFSYYPSIAMVIIVCYLLLAAFESRRARLIVGVLAIMIVIGYGFRTVTEVQYWCNSKVAFLRAAQLERNNAMAHYLIANELMGEGGASSGLVVSELRKSIDILPTAENMGLLAYILCFSNDAEDNKQCESLAKKALYLNSVEISALSALGALSLKSGKWNEARELLEKCVRNMMEPDYVVYEWLGMARHNQGDFKGALEAFNKALELRPENTNILNRIEQTRRMMNSPRGPYRQLAPNS